VFFSESLAGRFARFEPDRVLASRFTGPSTEDFLHKSLGMLNAPLPGLLQAHACCASALPLQSFEKQNIAKTLEPSAFLRDRKNIARIAAQSCRARCRVLSLRFSGRKMWCRCALAGASSCKNAGFFTAL
jgi:hypothetical protein